MPVSPEDQILAMERLKMYMESFGGMIPGMIVQLPGSNIPQYFMVPDRTFLSFSLFPDLYLAYRAGILSTLPYTALPEDMINFPGKWIEVEDESGLLLPDICGLFPRTWRPGQSIDPTRECGSLQLDAIRNLTGYTQFANGAGAEANADGTLFYKSNISTNGWTGFFSNSRTYSRWHFDASRQVPTDQENRQKNIAMTFAIFVGQYVS